MQGLAPVHEWKLDPLDRLQFEGELGNVAEFTSNSPAPEKCAFSNELKGMLEEAILALPITYRTVLVLRDVEEMSTAETAEVLSLTEANVKVRLHRAHELLRSELFTRAGATSTQAFAFHATRCDRVVQAVFEKLALNGAGN